MQRVAATTMAETEFDARTRREVPTAIRTALDSLLREYRRFEQERAKWAFERARLEHQVRVLTDRQTGADKACQALVQRVHMLEYALHQDPSSHESSDDREAVSALGDRAESKYKTLPSSFMTASAKNKKIGPGRELLVQYLQDLGYHPPKELSAFASVPPQSPLLESVYDKPSRVAEQPEDEKPSSESLQSMTSPLASFEEETAARVEEETAAPVQVVTLTKSFASSTIVDESKNDLDNVPLEVSRTSAEEGGLLAVAIGSGHNTTEAPWTLWKPEHTLLQHLDGVRCVRFHPKENLVLSASEDGMITAWETMNGTLAQTLHAHRGFATSLTFCNESGSLFASCGIDGRVILWNTPSANANAESYPREGSAIKHRGKVLTGHLDAVWSLCASYKAPILFSASADASIRAWNISSSNDNVGQCVRIYTLNSIGDGSDAIPTAICINSSGDRLFGGYTNGMIAEFDVETGQRIASISIRKDDTTARVTSCCSANDHENNGDCGKLKLISSTDNSVSFYDSSSGQLFDRILAHAHVVSDVKVNRSSTIMATSSHDSSIRFWDIAKRMCIQDLSPHQTHRAKYGEGVHSIVFHSVLDRFASGGADGAVKLYQY